MDLSMMPLEELTLNGSGNKGPTGISSELVKAGKGNGAQSLENDFDEENDEDEDSGCAPLSCFMPPPPVLVYVPPRVLVKVCSPVLPPVRPAVLLPVRFAPLSGRTTPLPPAPRPIQLSQGRAAPNRAVRFRHVVHQNQHVVVHQAGNWKG